MAASLQLLLCPSESRRYIYRAAVISGAERSVELWVGLIASELIDLTSWPAVIPADGMTDEELSVVKKWVVVS
jgi:hypothetical protein